MPEKRSVAILGGGIGGMTAAYFLSNTQAAREKLNVTIYESRWVPGGKCASVRGNDARIEEHGLHLFFGAYRNAGKLLRECYENLAPDEKLPYRDWRAGFEKHEDVYFMEQRGKGWKVWDVDPLTPNRSDLPGDDSGQTLWSMLVKVLGSLGDAPWPVRKLAFSAKAQRKIRDARKLCNTNPSPVVTPPKDHPERVAVETAIELLVASWQCWGRRMMLLGRPFASFRRLEMVIDVAVAALNGLVKDELLEGPDYLHKADQLELRDFLRKHGCVHADCAPVRGFYSGLFAYPLGDSQGSIAAGVGLRALLRSFGDYQGEIVWRMRGGMGEVVVLPLYRMLLQRGVKFEFFHRVKAIETDERTRTITGVRFARLAAAKRDTYDPEIEVELPDGRRVAAWPAEPKYEQLEGGDHLRTLAPRFSRVWPCPEDPKRDWTLSIRRSGEGGGGDGVRCDDVILAIPPEALKRIEHGFSKQRAEWREFLEGERRTQSVPTIGVQCWLSKGLSELGWNQLDRDLLSRLHGLFGSEPGEQPIVGAFARPFDVWADMTHLSVFERTSSKHTAYLVGVRTARTPLPTDEALRDAVQDQEEDTVRHQLQTWLETHAHHLWPRVANAQGEVDWSTFVDPQSRGGPERLRAQHLNVSLEPSDEYVLSLPGTIGARPPPDAWGSYENLSLAGDWIRNGLNAGTLEGAVMGGIAGANCVLRRHGLPEIEIAHASEI